MKYYVTSLALELLFPNFAPYLITIIVKRVLEPLQEINIFHQCYQNTKVIRILCLPRCDAGEHFAGVWVVVYTLVYHLPFTRVNYTPECVVLLIIQTNNLKLFEPFPPVLSCVTIIDFVFFSFVLYYFVCLRLHVIRIINAALQFGFCLSFVNCSRQCGWVGKHRTGHNFCMPFHTRYLYVCRNRSDDLTRDCSVGLDAGYGCIIFGVLK